MTRNVTIRSARWGVAGMLLVGVMAMAACDTVEPMEEDLLVVEAFLDAGQPLPPIRVRRTRPRRESLANAAMMDVADAEVVLWLDGTQIVYTPDPARPGYYLPPDAALPPVPPRSTFRIEVAWNGQQALATGQVPPRIDLMDVEVAVADSAVQAVLLDSLVLAFDTLNVALDAQEGFIYPVQVTLAWTVDFAETGADSLYWVETSLKPFDPFSSAVIDFFLLPGQILRERTATRAGGSQRTWTGVYAVPVESKDVALPAHTLRVAVLRSGQDYARFATSRDAPDQREPQTNVTGGLGIVAGVSVDSLRIDVQ